VGAIGVLVSGVVLVAAPFFALLFYDEYLDRRSGLDHVPVTPGELRAGLVGVAAVAAGAAWVLLVSVQLLRRRPWARVAAMLTYGAVAGWQLSHAFIAPDPRPYCFNAVIVGSLALLVALPAVGDHIAGEAARRRARSLGDAGREA
jgi:hypothetical protein